MKKFTGLNKFDVQPNQESLYFFQYFFRYFHCLDHFSLKIFDAQIIFFYFVGHCELLLFFIVAANNFFGFYSWSLALFNSKIKIYIHHKNYVNVQFFEHIEPVL